MSQQAPKPPDPFNPVDEEQVVSMVNEGGHDLKPDASPYPVQPTQTNTIRTDDYGDVATSISEALKSFRKLYNGEPAPKVVVHTDENDENHVSASWEKPKKK